MKRKPQTANRKPKIILALDVDNFKKAKYFVDKLYRKVKTFKVGPQALLSCGQEIIWYIHAKGAGVFLDLKFFDIPNTVANAIRMAVRLEIEMLTVHISGGKEMLENAVLAAREEAAKLKDYKIKRPLLIGVTVLTSKKASQKDVFKLAKEGLNCGLDGVVCSVREAKILREKLGRNFIIVTPGIRLKTRARDDQQRTATPEEALKAGSDFLVVGRPVLEARDPLGAIKELTQ